MLSLPEVSSSTSTSSPLLISTSSTSTYISYSTTTTTTTSTNSTSVSFFPSSSHSFISSSNYTKYHQNYLNYYFFPRKILYNYFNFLINRNYYHFIVFLFFFMGIFSINYYYYFYYYYHYYNDHSDHNDSSLFVNDVVNNNNYTTLKIEKQQKPKPKHTNIFNDSGVPMFCQNIFDGDDEDYYSRQEDISMFLNNFFRGSNMNDIDSNNNNNNNNLSSSTTIFIITPTYNRTTQRPDLIRLEQTLRLVPNIVWMVIEEWNRTSTFVVDLLQRTPVRHVHLLAPVQKSRVGRGFINRKCAFEWLREQARLAKEELYNAASDNDNVIKKTVKINNIKLTNGIIYMADDDNSYDLRVFEEIRTTRVVSMFPVGGLANYGISTPVVDSKTGRIIDFHDPFGKEFGRHYAVDMAGFAINLQYFLDHPQAQMLNTHPGSLEESLLRGLAVSYDQLEPKAANCTQVLVWHTRTESLPKLKFENIYRVKNYQNTNLPTIYSWMMND